MPPSDDRKIGPILDGQTGQQSDDRAHKDALLPALRAQEGAVAPDGAARRIVGALLAVALALILLGTGLFLFQSRGAGPPEVVVERVTLAPVARVLAVNGQVVGEVSVDIRPLVSGRITALPVREGDAVRVGDILARIDARAQAAIVRQAMAALDAALVAQDAAKDALARAQALGSGTSRVVLDAARRDHLVAKQEVSRLMAGLEQMHVALSLFTLTAPIAGTVTDLPVQQGQTVDPSTDLMTITDMDDLVIEAVVDESHALELHAGLSAVMRLTGSTEVLTGQVSRVARQVDAATGGLAVRLAPDAVLTAPIGLTVTANITIETLAEAITVPRAAVVTDGSGTAVFVLDGGGAKRRPVSVIEWPAARLVVTEGLSPADRVIADATGLSDGMDVSEVSR